MGLFDIFRKRKPSVSLPQLCYDVAYFILPHYVFEEPGRIADMCSETPDSAGPFFYIMACKMRESEPDIEDAKTFRWHTGRFGDTREHFTLEYPTPPPCDFSALSPEELSDTENLPVFAPHFSCVIPGRDESVGYYILGQSPMGGGTTIRCITADGANCNLGPGPAVELDAFLNAIREPGTA